MTNKPMLSVERELIQRIADHCKFWVDHPYLEAIADVEVELRALLDNPTDQHQGEPVAYLLLGETFYGTSGPEIGDFDIQYNHEACDRLAEAFPGKQIALYAEQPAPVADHTQCEECKGWGYHENHHEGGGTECGECGGSGNATVAGVMPERDLSAELVEMMNAPNYFENVSEVDRSKWFKWDWSEHKSRPINKFYLCDVVLADGRVLFNQSPHDFDWSGDEVAAARQGCSLEAARLNGVKP